MILASRSVQTLCSKWLVLVLDCSMFHIIFSDEEIKCNISRFADDTTLDGGVNYEDAEMLQYDLNRLKNWANGLQMLYDVDKLEVIYFGGSNRKTDYNMNDDRLGKEKLQQ